MRINALLLSAILLFIPLPSSTESEPVVLELIPPGEDYWIYEGGVFTRDFMLPDLPAEAASIRIERFDATNALMQATYHEPAESVSYACAEVRLGDWVLLTPLDGNGEPLAEGTAFRFDVLLTPAFMDYIMLTSEIANHFVEQVLQDGDPSFGSGRLIVHASDSLPDVTAFDPVVLLADGNGYFIIQFSSASAAQRCADFLSACEQVIYAEPDAPVFIAAPDETDADDSSVGIDSFDMLD